MDLSYLKSRTIINVEAAADRAGWVITLEDGEVIRIGGTGVVEKVRPSPTPETPTLTYNELESALCNAYSYALNLAAGLIESDDPFQWLPGWENRNKNSPLDLAALLRESAKHFEARSRSYQNYCHDVAHASAAIATLLHMDNSGKYHKLEDTCSGFPGIWELSARTGRALTDALYAVGDPNAERHEFIDLCEMMANHLLDERKDLSYGELIVFAQMIIHSPE